MEFLKSVLGDDLYSQVESKINEFNGNEANKEKQIKIGNLGSGEYVGKGKFDALQASLNGKNTELEKANSLIEDLKKNNQGNEDLQGKVSTYQQQVADLQKKLTTEKIENAVKLGLLEAKAIDVDYLSFKLKEKGDLELDESGKIKGWDDKISALKTQIPTQFEGAGSRKFEENKLPDDDGGDRGNSEPKSLEEALRMQYEPNKN